MVVMYNFVFWFSTRFGSVVVAIFTLIQSMMCLIASIIGMENQEAIQNQLDLWLRTYNMLFMKDALDDMKRGPEIYLIGFITYLSLHSFSCFLLLYGALKISVWFVYPFLMLEIARLIFLTVGFVITMLLVEENILNLGVLIGSCSGGGFVLLFLFYLWFCTLSFIQIVKELEYKMGHFEEENMNLKEYQGINVLQPGTDYYLKGGGFAPLSDYNHRYNEKSISENLNIRHNVGSYYSNVMAKPVY